MYKELFIFDTHFVDAMLFLYQLCCYVSFLEYLNLNSFSANAKFRCIYSYFRIEEAKRAMKRPSSDADRYNDIDRKRSSNDRRFEPPPPPRFDTAIRSSNYDRPPEKKRVVDDYPSSSSKRNEEYKSSSRGGGGGGGGTTSIGSSDVSSFKRPLNDSYKRSNDIEPPSRSGGGGGGGGSGGYDQRVVSSLGSSTKDNRFNDSVDNRHIR